MKQTKSYVDSNGQRYSDTFDNGKLVKRHYEHLDILHIWERKGTSWLHTAVNRKTGELKSDMQLYPPTPTHPIAYEDSQEVNV